MSVERDKIARAACVATVGQGCICEMLGEDRACDVLRRVADAVLEQVESRLFTDGHRAAGYRVRAIREGRA